MGVRILAALALICLTTVNSQPSFWQGHVDCEMCLDGVCYGITKLSKYDANALSIGDPIAIDRVENILYYHDGVDVKSMNLNDKTIRTVFNGMDSTRLAVDQATRDLYFNSGGRDIVKYNPVTNHTEHIHGNRFLRHLYFKDKLYTAARDQTSLKLYVLRDSELELFVPLQEVNMTDNIMIDKRGDLYFRQGSAIRKLPAGGNSSVLFNDRKNFAYTTNKDGIAYFIDRLYKNFYRLDYTSNEIVEVGVFDVHFFGFSADLKSVYFDKYNNVIYIEDNMFLYYLTANAGRCRVKEAKNMFDDVYPAIQKL